MCVCVLVVVSLRKKICVIFYTEHECIFGVSEILLPVSLFKSVYLEWIICRHGASSHNNRRIRIYTVYIVRTHNLIRKIILGEQITQGNRNPTSARSSRTSPSSGRHDRQVTICECEVQGAGAEA